MFKILLAPDLFFLWCLMVVNLSIGKAELKLRYALTVNPTIYVSCIEQFWSTAKAQTINEETQIHALLDGKKIVITESFVRRDLQFADEDGTDCLPTTKTILKLECLSPKKTDWNEFSSNIDNAIICLATNQKFNFSKMVFDGMTRNLDSLSAKFLMYPRFLQVFLDKQLDKVPSHNPVYNASCHTKKVFANMKRIGKDFSGKVTHLFDTMLIQHQSEVGDSLERAATTASSLEAENWSQPPRYHGDTIARTRFENVSKTSYDSPLGGVNTPRSDEDRDYKPEKRVKKLEQRGRLITPGLKRLYKVGTSRRVESSVEASLGDQEDASKQGRNIDEIDADVDILLVHEDARIQGRFDDEDMFDTSVFNDEEVFARQDMADQDVNVAKKEVSAVDPVTTAGEVVTTANVDISTASVPITVSTATPTTPPTTTIEDDMTLAETLMEIKSAKPKAIGVVMQEPSEIPRISATQQQIQEKAQGSRDKALRVQEISNKPPTKMQKRTTMCNYLKNMAGYKHNQLRHKSFDNIQKLFDKALKRVNTFVAMDTEKVERSKAKAVSSETRVEESWKRIFKENDKNKAKNDKTKHGLEMCEKTKPKSQSSQKVNKIVKVNPDKSQSQLREAEAENIT
ncbi:hypothetical protein Tco_0763797 [Tanacetum coccineum]